MKSIEAAREASRDRAAAPRSTLLFVPSLVGGMTALMTSLTFRMLEQQVACAKLVANTLAPSASPVQPAHAALIPAAITAEIPVLPDQLLIAATATQESPIMPDAPLVTAAASQETPLTPDALLVTAAADQETPLTPGAPLITAAASQETPLTPDGPLVTAAADQETSLTPDAPLITAAADPVVAPMTDEAAALVSVQDPVSIDGAASTAILETQQIAAEAWLDAQAIAAEQSETLAKILPEPRALASQTGPRLPNAGRRPAPKAQQMPVSSANAAAKKPKVPSVSSDRPPIKRGPAKK